MNWKKILIPLVIIASILAIRTIMKDDARLDVVHVQGGAFMMGDSNGEFDEMPVHQVMVNSFYISKHEVTNTQYCIFLNEYGNQFEDGVEWIDVKNKLCKIDFIDGEYIPEEGYENHPVLAVNWYGARAYCEWKGGRLPTEAEWEFAARGGTLNSGNVFSGSNNLHDVAWTIATSNGQPHPVGIKKPNELGLYDMSGNAWEWVADKYNSNYYRLSPMDNPQGAPVGKHRVVRGGSFLSFGEDNLKVSSRVSANPRDGGSYSFRVAFDNSAQ